MRAINISNAKRRDAQVVFDAQYEGTKIQMVLPDGQEKTNVKFLEATVDIDTEALLKNIQT